MSFPPGNKMFQFPGYRPLAGGHGSHDRVPPFGNQRINACLQLPVAYRSKPRPSSPVDALASPVRPYLLDHITQQICSRIPISLMVLDLVLTELHWHIHLSIPGHNLTACPFLDEI